MTEHSLIPHIWRERKKSPWAKVRYAHLTGVALFLSRRQQCSGLILGANLTWSSVAERSAKTSS